MAGPPKSDGVDLSEVTYVKIVTIGHINKPTSDEEMARQTDVLNACLQHWPKGRIIGKNASTFMFTHQDLPGRYEQTTYHIGWKRKPQWLIDAERQNQI